MKKSYYDPIETAPRSDIVQLQSNKLKTIVKHAYENSKFYKDKFDEAGITPDDVKSVEDVGKLPFLSKESLREDQAAHPPWGRMLAMPFEQTQRGAPDFGHHRSAPAGSRHRRGLGQVLPHARPHALRLRRAVT